MLDAEATEYAHVNQTARSEAQDGEKSSSGDWGADVFGALPNTRLFGAFFDAQSCGPGAETPGSSSAKTQYL